MFTKYCLFSNYDKVTPEKGEVLTIISNFSSTIPELTPYYISFFIKFFFFIESYFKIEIDFKHRKSIIIIIFDMFYDLMIIINDNEIEVENTLIDKNWNEQFVKLVELMYILLKNNSINNIDDAYLIYRNCGAFIKKINLAFNEQLSENHFTLIFFLVFTVFKIVGK